MSVAHRRTAHILVDHQTIRPTSSIQVLAASVPLFILGTGAYLDLVDELHGPDAAVRWLLGLSSQLDKPIGLNLPDPAGTSTCLTTFIPPPGWSRAKLAGWTCGHHEDLEALFGPVGTPAQSTGRVRCRTMDVGHSVTEEED